MFDINQIKEIIPHAYPFLLIDRIISIDDETKKIIALKNVTINEQFFTGHFPSNPVMPGVLILEALAQTGAFYVLNQEEYKGKTPYFAGCNNVKWKRKVVPGDQLILEMTLENIRRGIGKGKGEVFVDGELACVAELTFAIR